MIRRFKKSEYVDAVQFLNTHDNTQDIISFVGLPISIDYKEDGVRLRVIKHALDVAVVKVGDYIIRKSDGKITCATKEEFESEYTESPEP